MKYTYGVVGVLTLIAAAFFRSPEAAICGVMFIVAGDIVGYLAQILAELRAAHPVARNPIPEDLVVDKEMLQARDRRLAKQAAQAKPDAQR